MQLAPVTMAPATCLLCNRTPEEGEFFVDTLVKLVLGPRRDRVYVCPQCGGKVAAALGWVDPRDHDAQVEAGTAASARIAELEAEKQAREEDAVAWLKEVAAVYGPQPKTRARKPVDEPVSEG